MKRKGYGKGLGMGYKNLMPMDSHIHSLSAKGMKSVNYANAVIPKADAIIPKAGAVIPMYDMYAKSERVGKFLINRYKEGQKAYIEFTKVVGTGQFWYSVYLKEKGIRKLLQGDTEIESALTKNEALKLFKRIEKDITLNAKKMNGDK